MKDLNLTFTLMLTAALTACSVSPPNGELANTAVKAVLEPARGTLEVVAELDICPGNAAVSKEGRIFMSIHPSRPDKYQLVEITGKTTYVPFPNAQSQSTADTKSDDKLDTPLGIVFDEQNRLWVIDMGFNSSSTRLIAYDIQTKTELMRFDIPQEFAPKNGSFVQDLAVDEKNGFVYLADVRHPRIIVVDINKGTFSGIVDLPSMEAEDINLVIDGEVQYLRGSPTRIALNPITLSADKETLYYGALNGTKWYQVPTKPIRDGKKNDEVVKLISTLSEKPMTDGIATDENGNHYFTNIQNRSIDALSADGTISTLKKDPRLDWPDSVRIHGDWLYIAANQIHKSPTWTGGADLAVMPFRILRLKYR